MDSKELSADSTVLNADKIRKSGDDIRKRILDVMQVDIGNTAPNVFKYSVRTNSIGLNEISNVDMGYACSTIGNNGENFSKRNPYLNELEYNVSLMKESENAIVVLNGGLFSFIPKSRNGEMLSYENQVAYFYSLFKDLAKEGKIVAMVRGTEEHRILKNHQIDVLDVLQEALGLNGKVCNDALINVSLQDDLIKDAKVGIRTINWNNTATTGAYIGRKMEERATKRSGADIYIARTTMNYFKSAIAGESVNGRKISKPIYMISGGSYTPFKGAMTAGAEYNSIKDGELMPNSFWYKVTVEPNNASVQGERPYIVRVNPINYVAHQVNYQGTDKLVATIENKVVSESDKVIQEIVDRYPSAMREIREAGRKELRETLISNKEIASKNAEIAEYIKSKKGEIDEIDDDGPFITDQGSNVGEITGSHKIVFDSPILENSDQIMDK